VAAVAVLALLAIIAGPRLLKRRSQNQPAPAIVVQQPPAQSKVQRPVHSTIPSAPEKKSVLSSAKSLAPIPAPAQAPAVAKAAPQSVHSSAQHALEKTSEKKSTAGNPAPLPPPVRAETPATTPSSGIFPGKVVQQVLPEATQKARDTIRGKVRLSVKVSVDESGDVTQATLDSPGPSQYFADRTLKAAQLWKFAPAKMDGRHVPSTWLLYFEIDPATTTVHSKQTAP
jgi:TonB family protein